jgi:isovaleryl-CoA dehydrogenase
MSGDWRELDIANPTEEHAMLREMLRDFVLKEVEPQALEHDRDERFNSELFRSLGDQGLLGISVPHEYGGLSSTRNYLTQTPASALPI